MERDQIRLAALQMFTTAFVALGSVFLAMGISNLNYTESSLLSLIQFEFQLRLDPNVSSELLESLDTLRSAINSRMEQARNMLDMGMWIVSIGVIVGCAGLFMFRKF